MALTPDIKPAVEEGGERSRAVGTRPVLRGHAGGMWLCGGLCWNHARPTKQGLCFTFMAETAQVTRGRGHRQTLLIQSVVGTLAWNSCSRTHVQSQPTQKQPQTLLAYVEADIWPVNLPTR